ncbi:BZ3500_MvSof-1268-A1-R1_Chr4-3g07289 [Microbotryum saponariae]|uniref:Amine oxidase n=1 Tax=Microbotryum saponariae TaxID=289078 RepID=A0A2X0MXS3_9BASI|nr:BZ3500_MvSof-1268-A1-R1_Chr4-3g07289 [Microbotryum saponariae]SDA06952.1 BZ3501_MvSof-1269-A2-R1_Chr4-2g06998 [Microbotryum saponariae]
MPSVEAISSAPGACGARNAAKAHPLDPLTVGEIQLVSAAFKNEMFQRGVLSVKSCHVDLVEPPKLEVIAYLGISTSPTDVSPVSSGVMPKRRAEAALIDTLTGDVYVLTAEIVAGTKAIVEKVEKLPEGVQPAITNEEMTQSEEVVRNDPEVIRLCAEVGVKKEQIMCDCWSIGYEHRFGKGVRLQQAFVYARLGADEHLYAHPLDFNCVVDTNAEKILKIGELIGHFAPHRTSATAPDALSGTTAPHTVEGDSFKDSGRDRIPPPLERHDYLPDLIREKAQSEGRDWDVRQDLKPLHVQQPEGVSFEMKGNRIKWQNWDMHIGFNYREGIVLNHVQHFDREEGRYRPIMYRASFAEMVVPYAAPEWPHPRKFAFDVGEYGIGMMANSLTLGCDCLGSIHYLDAVMSGHDGQPIKLDRAVCIHEEDDGLLWKHTDFRPGGRAHSVRSRKLIIQMICTVANYEYLFAWGFKQDGTMELEIKLTGILNTYLLAQGEHAEAFGTQVAPRIVAHHHQHIFCLRLDPMIDGLNNSVVETEIHPLEAPTGSDENWAGNGFEARKRVLQTTKEGARLADAPSSRMWSFVNQDKKHYSTGTAAGYKLMCKDFPPLLAKEDSLVARRATFAKKNLWVTPFVDGQFFPAGKYPTQSFKAPEDSLEFWIKDDKPIVQKDIVTWVSFGVTHLPRAEDFPVSFIGLTTSCCNPIVPAEHVLLQLKPVNFFRANPSLDTPASSDARSVMALPPNAGNECCH